MEKRLRLKKNEDFQKVFRNGKSVANRQFVVYQWKNREKAEFRVGISVSKKIGNAVMRNRIKRLIRESVRKMKDRIQGNADIIIIARQPTSSMSYHELSKSLHHVMKKARLLHKPVRDKEGN